jgi:cell division protein FtsA
VVQHPRYATAMGLLLEGMAQKKRGIQAHRTRTFKQVLGNMKSWFEKNF